MEWIGLPENTDDHFGFVYKITNITNDKIYIGKKQFKKKTKRPPLKGKKRARVVMVKNDWEDYYGSSEVLKKEVATYGKENFKREILHFASCKWEGTFLEVIEQLKHGVIFSENSYNGILNIRIGRPPKALEDKYRNWQLC